MFDNFDAAFMLVRPSWASGLAAPEMCALLISTKGIEHIIVSTYPGGEVAVRPERVRLQEPDLPEHGLEASMIVTGKAGAPPRPRTHVGQAGTGSNPAEPSV